MCRFENGAMGQMYFSRIATAAKWAMPMKSRAPKGAIRFDQEDQNALWLYQWMSPKPTRVSQDPDRAGASRLLTFLPRARPRHGLPRSDHHRGAGFLARDRHQNTRLANLSGRAGCEPSRRRGIASSRQKRGSTSSCLIRKAQHDNQNRQRALFVGHRISQRSGLPNVAICVGTMRRRGLQGIELGPIGFMPEDPQCWPLRWQERSGNHRRRCVSRLP